MSAVPRPTAHQYLPLQPTLLPKASAVQRPTAHQNLSLGWPGERAIESKNGGEATVVYVALNVCTCGCVHVGAYVWVFSCSSYITKNPNSRIKSCGCSTLLRYFQQMTKPGSTVVSVHISINQLRKCCDNNVKWLHNFKVVQYLHKYRYRIVSTMMEITKARVSVCLALLVSSTVLAGGE